jgi:3-oxoacyl-[acyl-carrier protein] reductase
VTRPDGTKHAVGFQGGYDEEEKWLVFNNSSHSTWPHTCARVGDIPLRRIGTPTDAARAILAVVSPLFSYVSGQVSQTTIFSRNVILTTNSRQSW